MFFFLLVFKPYRMLLNSSSIVSLISDKNYDRKIHGYVNVLQDEHWRKLYAVLKANLLFLFESSERLEIPVLLIIMEDCVVELADDNATGRQHSFSIKFNTTGHTYIMAATDYDALQNWVSVLTSCSFEFMEATRQSLESAEDDEMEKRRAKGGESAKNVESQRQGNE